MSADSSGSDPPLPVRVLILHNQPVLPKDHPDAESEHEILFTTEHVRRTLIEAGYGVETLGVSRDPVALIDGLRESRPDVVFNLFEGLADFGDTEAYVAGILEWLELPFTGCPYQTLCLARSKPLTKHVLAGAGLPTAKFFVTEDAQIEDFPLGWPAIVKPALQDASVGIEQSSVVTNREQLDRQVAYVLKRYGPPVLVEEYIPGREFHVTVVEASCAGTGLPGLCVLPLAEIVFLERDSAYWPIYSYEAKWKTEGREYQMTPLKSPVTLDPERTDRLGRIALQAFRLLGCRDYARIDVRMTPIGQFFILEVNPNPFLNSAGVIHGLKALGRTHAEFLVGLVRGALGRGSGHPRLG